MARIPEETLQQVLAATNIVDLIGRSVKLRRAGSNYVGLCPFHNEKSPSFNVRPSTNSYHCFGCGASGTAFRWLMEHEGLTFMEAVRRLAEAAGIRIQEEVWDANAEAAAKQRALMLKAHKEIAAWYHNLLLRSPLAAPAREYLKGRGISSDIAKRWEIGYAPASLQLLRQWAAPFKFGRDLLVEAGLLGWSEEDNAVYPRFRHRLMFPIRNENGEVIGFSGRLLDPEAKTAKYLNTSDTPIFNKSRVLFGFDKARRFISKAGQAIVCEGQIDTIMVHEAGFPNVVAGQGTAFTEYHAQALKRQADEVVLCYDSDSSGQDAVTKAFRILAPHGLIVKVAALPAGDDPDTFIRNRGPEAFAGLLKNARDFLDHHLAAAGARRDLTEMRERVRFAREVVDLLRAFDSPLARQTAIQRVARSLDLPEDILLGLVKDADAEEKKKAGYKKDKEEAPARADPLATQDKTSLLLCHLALVDAEVLVWLRGTGMEHILSELPGSGMLARVWQGAFDPMDASAFSVFLAGLDRDEEAAFTRLLHRPRPPGRLEDARVALVSLQISARKLRAQRLKTQLKSPAITPEDTAEIQREIVELHREITRLQSQISAGAPLAE
ncbi:MAG TPA: DNA primase [Verrucomicrobiales bacterium]|nr:DNA primase [Verrucomicrobiales bacterium]